MTAPRETALIVPVPEAEPHVGPWRAELDRAAGWGVPAHLTVLYPFVDPSQVDVRLVDALTEVFAGFETFTYALTETRRFGDEVLYLAPDPDGPFRALTEAVSRRWPEHPPYGGAHDDVIPHLTIAEGPQDLAKIAAAETSVAPQLPIHAEATEVVLMSGAFVEDSWRTLHSFPLRPS